MLTKLVYVLTCASEGNYIEQALLAIWSARQHNPSAQIILFVDDVTDKVMSEGRNEVLKYVTEKIVIPFDADKTMVYRSRWIKTSVRRLVVGDYLFVDCDTITTRSLEEIDLLGCKMGAVPDSHLAVREFGKDLLNASKAKVAPLGIDLEKEEFYFSSGVLYVKDTPETHALYDKWHEVWLHGVQNGVNIDQPSLAKANIEAGHLIERIDDGLNCVIYTQPAFAKDASILHFTAFRNPSWLFSKRVLAMIRKEEGIQDWMMPFILDPVSTYIPFRYTVSRMSFNELIRIIHTMSKAAMVYSQHVDGSFSDMQPSARWQKRAKGLFKKKCFFLGSAACLFPSWINIKVNRSNPSVPNVCSK